MANADQELWARKSAFALAMRNGGLTAWHVELAYGPAGVLADV